MILKIHPLFFLKLGIDFKENIDYEVRKIFLNFRVGIKWKSRNKIKWIIINISALV